jgi:endonuclease/exonuclease/phosphatase family metal-dependent hydrolase
MKMIFFILICIIFLLLSFLLWASYPWSVNESVHHSEINMIETDEMMDLPEHPFVLKILSYNIGFLYGRGSEGPGYEYRSKDYYEKSLNTISSEIKKWDVDIVCLQEIDFESERSHFIDQAAYIAKKAGFPYVAQANSWVAHYIPFPYWPLKNHFGRMKSGGAILSRYPLSHHSVHLLSKPQSQPWWYNLFYLHRYFQQVTLSLGHKEIHLINLHLEAFDEVDRKKQLKKLIGIINSEQIDFVAGDFNMLPQSASKKSHFFNDDNYENDSSYTFMLNSGLNEVIPDDFYAKDESLYFTYPSWKPDRRLDYIWYKKGLKLMKAEVLPSASSDHLPLKASFQIGEPQFNSFE